MQAHSMTQSEALFARAARVAPGGVHSPVRAFRSVGGTPVFFQSAEGAYLRSVDGCEYVDFCQSFGPNLLGHRDPEVEQVVRETVGLAWTFGACEPYSLELAEWLTTRLPWVNKLRFVSSGTEAVMSALRVARAATGREGILKFAGCYHGHSDALLVKAGSGLAGESASDSAGVGRNLVSGTFISNLDDETQLERIFLEHGPKLAAVIIEPLPANYGLLIQRPEFLRRLVQLARQAGALVIFDEVISGFRASMGGMVERLDLCPDLVTYGKVLGGGFPVGAYGGRAELMDLVAPAGAVYQAGTLSANPFGMRAGLATLQKAERLNVFSELQSRTDEFVTHLRQGFQQAHVPLDVTSYASLFWLHPQAERPLRSLEHLPATIGPRFQKLFHQALKRQIYLPPSGYEVGFVSLAHTPTLLQQSAQKIVEAAVAANIG